MRNTDLFGGFRRVFNLGSIKARCRVRLLFYSLITSVNVYLTAGIFYSGFLASAGMEPAQVGLIAAIPFLGNLFSIFSPKILDRFPRRRTVLVSSRITYHLLNILGVTLIPFIFSGSAARTAAFCITILLASIVNAISQPGIVTWHISVVPEDMRSDYFGYIQTVSAVASGAIILVCAFLRDRLAESSLAFFTGVRVFALLIALLDVFFMALPEEPEYQRTEDIRIGSVFSLSWREKRFFLSMVFVFLWMFTQSVAVTNIVDNYLTIDCGVPYMFICAINASYSLFLVFFQPFWKKRIARTSWFRTFAFSAILHAPTTLLYAFTTSENFWVLMLIVRLTQHVIGVGLNITAANIYFVNMPEKDRTSYMSFYFLVSNLAGFAGMGTGTLVIKLIGGRSFPLFGVPITGPQVLLLIQAVLQFAVPLAMMLSMKYLEPADSRRGR